MDLSYGKAYEDFRSEVHSFLQTNKDQAPRGGSMRSEATLAWQKLLIDHGYAARTIPRNLAAMALSQILLKARIIAEEFAQARVSGGLGGQGISMLVPTLLEMGTREQQQQFIAPTLHGDMVWCQGYSEPGAGSDLASLRTSAVLDGDEWVVNGQKIWTSTAHLADWIFCLVRTEPDAPKHKGISFLLFDMKTPGIEIRPLVDMTGVANFNEVFFTDVRVPQASKLWVNGAKDGWWRTPYWATSAIAWVTRTPPLPGLNALLEIMKEETVDGERVIDNPVYLDRVMKIQGEVMAMRVNDLRVLSAKVNKSSDAKLARMVTKLQGTELRHELEGLAIDVMGELGLAYNKNPYLRDAGSWQSQYMYFLGLIIGGGTSQIQKNIISERGLDMPREPKVEKRG